MQTLTLLQVLLARHKETTNYYAVKVLQKKIIMKKKEVNPHEPPCLTHYLRLTRKPVGY